MNYVALLWPEVGYPWTIVWFCSLQASFSIYIYLHRNRMLNCLWNLRYEGLSQHSLLSDSVRSIFVPVKKIRLLSDYVAFDSDIRYHRDSSFVIQSLERGTNLDSHHHSDHVRILKLKEILSQTHLEPRHLKQSSEILRPDNHHYTFWRQRARSWVQQAGCGLNLFWAVLSYVYMTSICGQFRHELLSSADSRAETRKTPETEKCLKLFHIPTCVWINCSQQTFQYTFDGVLYIYIYIYIWGLRWRSG